MTVYASIEVYAVVEGSLTILFTPPSLALSGPGTAGTPARLTGGGLRLQRLDLRGIIGVIARGYAEIDVWVLYARVEVIVFGEAESHLGWLHGEKAHLDFAFRMGQSFGASCRVARAVQLHVPFLDDGRTGIQGPNRPLTSTPRPRPWT